MTKSRFSLPLAFCALIAFAPSVHAQAPSIVGSIQSSALGSGARGPGALGSSVVQSAPVVQAAPSVVDTAPIVQMAPSVFNAPTVSHAGCSSCGQSASIAAPSQITGPTSSSHSGCCLPGPTVPPGLPQLPIQSCCNNIGPLNIPPLTTPVRYDTPPIGRSVGRPIFGRWSGY